METCVEARNYVDVQFTTMSWVSEQKTNLVRRLLVLSEAALRQAPVEIVRAVEH
jgi:hypothetical protein